LKDAGVLTSIGLQVFWRHHHHKPHGTLVLEHLIRPSTHRPDTLDSRYAIICYQYLPQTFPMHYNYQSVRKSGICVRYINQAIKQFR